MIDGDDGKMLNVTRAHDAKDAMIRRQVTARPPTISFARRGRPHAIRCTSRARGHQPFHHRRRQLLASASVTMEPYELSLHYTRRHAGACCHYFIAAGYRAENTDIARPGRPIFRELFRHRR